ncbi:MAG: hypothetical protein HYY17_14915 [Planctomycetes bacterium]|nr:hypothetical protein [Planctomycetota bacterium]
MNLIDPEELPYPFCPGCSHELIFKSLAAAFEKSGLDARRVVVVSDIGCHGIADRMLRTHTFHGLHGRSLTYAAGIKLANPSLKVVVLIGDGGCGIGGAHLVNAARRNAGICAVVFNNFNFGMTGGQHSVTTPCGGRTATTPKGNAERGLDLCRLADACGANFVARTTAFDPALVDVLADGIAHDGFAFLDIWGLCTAYYMKRNDLRKAELVDTAKNMPGYGVLRRESQPEWAASQPKGSAPEPRLDANEIPVLFRAELKEPLRVVLAGSAGMKVRTAASLLASAAILSGLRAAQKDTFPVTVTKGFSLSELIVSPEPIEDLEIVLPDCLVISSEDGLDKTKALVPLARRVVAKRGLDVTRDDATLVDLPGVRPAELTLAMTAPLLRDAIPAEAMRESVLRFGHVEERERLLAAVGNPAAAEGVTRRTT